MKKNTIYLDITREENCLKLAIYKSGDSILPCKEKSVSMKQVEARYLEMRETLNKTGGNDLKSLHELRTVGTRICDELLPSEIKEKLRNTSDGQYLILTLDDALVHIPWELFCVDQCFLCERFNIGRQVRTKQHITGNENRTLKNRLRVLILANPGGDLPGALEEGKKLYQYLNQQNQIIPERESRITPNQLRECIKAYDIIHYAGHSEYNLQYPEKSAWKLKDKNLLTAEDISDMEGGAAMPALIFSNACQSAHTEPWNKNRDNLFGLVNAFMRAGVKHYIGTGWKIMDEPSHPFALRFYEFLISGKTIGEAVRLARLRKGDDICWASYLLYGDPTFTYFPKKEEISKVVFPESSAKSVSLQSDKERATSPLSEIETPSDTGESQRKVISAFAYKKWIPALLILIISISILIIASIRIEPEASDPCTSTLSVVVKKPSQGKDDFICHLIESQIKEKCPQITLLERTSFDILMKEYDIIDSKLIPRKNRFKPKLLPVNLYLIIKIDNSDDNPFVLMRLADTKTGAIKELFEELLKDGTLVIQKERLCKNLIEKLNSISQPR